MAVEADKRAKIVNILVDYTFYARQQSGRKNWKWKATKSTKNIIVDWKAEDVDWTAFKDTVIKSCNAKFEKVPEILQTANSGKNIGLIWAPYIQHLKEFPKGTVKDCAPLAGSVELKAWLDAALLTDCRKQVGLSLVMHKPGSRVAHAKQVCLAWLSFSLHPFD